MDGQDINRKLPPPPSSLPSPVLDASNNLKKRPPALELTTFVHRYSHGRDELTPPMSESPTAKEAAKTPEDQQRRFLSTTSEAPGSSSATRDNRPQLTGLSRASISIPSGPTWAPQGAPHQNLPSIQPRYGEHHHYPPPPSYLDRQRSQSIPQYHSMLPQSMYSTPHAYSPSMQYGSVYGQQPGYFVPVMTGPAGYPPPDITRVPKHNARRGKGHVAKACLNCKKAHLSCDNSRPCGRCVNGNKAVSA